MTLLAHANRLEIKPPDYGAPLTRPFSYEKLKNKGIYIFSYMNGKQYAISTIKPMPSYFWHRLEYLPERIQLFEVKFSSMRKEYLIKVQY